MTANQREGVSAQSTITGKQEYITSTGGALNTTATIGGASIPVTGATLGVPVAILDGSGNQITSFGGGTQYTDGGTPPTHPIGPTLEFNNAGTWATVGSATPLPVSATFSPSGTQDTNLKQINGNTTLTGNGVTGTGSQRVTISSDNTPFTVNAAQSGTWTNTVTQATAANLNATIVGTGTFAVQATLSAETTKVIGVVRNADGSGNLLTSTANALDVNIKSGSIANTTFASTQSGTWNVGSSTATGSAVPANAFYNGILAGSSLPTAATPGNLTGVMGDKFGRIVVLNNGIRDIEGSQTTTITSSTSETTIITATASVFHDLVSIFISNTSATAARVDIRDTTAGSVIFQLYIPAGDMRGVSLTTPWPQTTVNTNWTAQSSASVADLRVSALFISNK